MINFLRKYLPKFLLLSIFCIASLFAEEPAKSFTFFQLDALSKKEKVPKEGVIKGQHIQIRGFLYKIEDDRLILAAEPNLKSCCIGSSSKRQKQLLVFGDVSQSINQTTAVTLQGALYIDSKNNFPYSLHNAVVIPENNQSLTLFACLGAVFILACTGCLYLRSECLNSSA